MVMNVVVRIVLVQRNRSSNNRNQLKRNSSFKLINLTTVLRESGSRFRVRSLLLWSNGSNAPIICHVKIQANAFAVKELSDSIILFIVYQLIKHHYIVQSNNFS